MIEGRIAYALSLSRALGYSYSGARRWKDRECGFVGRVEDGLFCIRQSQLLGKRVGGDRG